MIAHDLYTYSLWSFPQSLHPLTSQGLIHSCLVPVSDLDMQEHNRGLLLLTVAAYFFNFCVCVCILAALFAKFSFPQLVYKMILLAHMNHLMLFFFFFLKSQLYS